jgi:hypothetical protein
MLLLSFLLGAAVVHFKLPTSEYLRDAFTGARAWAEQRNELAEPSGPVDSPISQDVHDPEKAFDGLTLYTTNVGTQAVLLNMRGEVVHKWSAPFSRVWPRPAHVREPVEDAKIYFFGCYLYPNGDLLTVFHGTGDTPYGYGLAKLDRDSNVLWTYSANVHHAVDVGDDGTIYVLTHQIIREMPRDLEFIGTPALVDSLVLLSPEGKELKTIPILEAFRDSPYALLLPSRATGSDTAWDVLHANFVEVLSPRLAPYHPLFRAGQVLLSVRELDTLAVVDTESRRVVWAARGPWRAQHDPHFLDNGRLLLFDNRGASTSSRVFEYDPQTQACPWSYSGEGGHSFHSVIQGRSQRLPNGNTLIVNSRNGILMEVTRDKELVWSCCCHAHVPWARRYPADQLTFLKGTSHARP